MNDKESEQTVKEMKRGFENTMQGQDLYLCIVALTEMIVEVLLTADDRTDDDYDPFAVFADLYEEAFASAEYVETDEIELLDEKTATAH